MIKILHSADWHLDSPLQGHSPEQTAFLRRALLEIPGKIAALCRQEACDLMLLSGDLFDGAYTRESYLALYAALEEVSIPIFIAPGNHDFMDANSPWTREIWPENVFIFTQPHITSVDVPGLNCKVYGAGFTSMDCPGLLEGFRAADNSCAIGILHGDPTQLQSPYCPITKAQVELSGLTYLALGHIHKGGAFTAGKTLCAWPGCPMGRGYDEPGQKGVLIATVGEETTSRFVPLDTPKFYDLETEVTDTAETRLTTLLPAVGNTDFYRVTFIGNSEAIDLAKVAAGFPQFPNLVLRDKTTPPIDVWGTADEDSFEGMYFRLLWEALDTPDAQSQKRIRLAAEISRQILDGQEVTLP